jgi:hypothetical protein
MNPTETVIAAEAGAQGETHGDAAAVAADPIRNAIPAPSTGTVTAVPSGVQVASFEGS